MGGRDGRCMEERVHTLSSSSSSPHPPLRFEVVRDGEGAIVCIYAVKEGVKKRLARVVQTHTRERRDKETNQAQPRRPLRMRSATPRSGASGHAGRPQCACVRTRPLPTSNTTRHPPHPPPLLRHILLRLRRLHRRRCRWRRTRRSRACAPRSTRGSP